MKIIMLGAPGAGKGTQAKKIAAKYGIPHISTGDIFRANIKNGTELGQKAKTYMDQGLLVPDELVVDLVVDRVNQEDCTSGYVLDGFPRTIPQAEALDKALAELDQKVDYAINVEVPDENIIRRIDVNAEYIYLADGAKRTVRRRKRKNPKHLQIIKKAASPSTTDDETIRSVINRYSRLDTNENSKVPNVQED